MKNLLIIVIFVFSFESFGQKPTVEKQERQHSPNLKLSYFGNWNYPGVKLGTELMLKNRIINPKRNRSPREKQSFVTLNLGVFDHYEYRTNAFIQTEYLFRKTYKNGIFADYATGIGLSYKIAKQVPTFQENTDGSITEKKPDNSYVMVSFLGGFGYDFEKTKKRPFKVFARTGMVIHFGDWLTPKPITEFGLIMPLTAFKKK
jgi:hypothetical protein